MKISFVIAALLWAHVPSALAQGPKLLQALSDLSPCAVSILKDGKTVSLTSLSSHASLEHSRNLPAR